MEREDLRKIYEHQVYMTLFADSKAGGFMLLFTGIVSAVTGSGRLGYATGVFAGRFELANFVGLTAFVALLISLGLLIWTIVPRAVPPSPTEDKSVIFWGHIAHNASGPDYARRLRALDNDAWIEQWAEQIHAVAKVAELKFKRLNDAVWVGLAGSLLMGWLFAIT